MALFLLITAALACVLYGVSLAAVSKPSRRPLAVPDPRSQQLRMRQRQAARTAAERAKAAKDLQIAILQGHSAPDFRRPATYAARAASVGVPTDFRQRQFRRLRPLIIEQLLHRLRAGQSPEEAARGLPELVTNCGIAVYEAEYIISAAQRQGIMSAQPSDYRSRLQQAHREHERRLDAINRTQNLPDELREQLTEAEFERFRTELLDDLDEGR